MELWSCGVVGIYLIFNEVCYQSIYCPDKLGFMVLSRKCFLDNMEFNVLSGKNDLSTPPLQ